MLCFDEMCDEIRRDGKTKWKSIYNPRFPPKRQYFYNVLIVFWVINATFLQLLNLEYVEHI